VIVILAATDIVRGYRVSVEETGRELETQARIIAEQTARSVQAVDVVLRYISEQFKKGALSRSNAEELHNYLREQAVGLVQADGLAMHNADGTPRAISWVYPAPDTTANVAALPAFQAVRDDPKIDLLVGDAIQSRVDGQWFFPIGRRLESANGGFAGTIAARGRIEYFQQFYRDVQLDRATKVTLMHNNGTLLARHPPVEDALGQRFELFDQMLASRAAGQPGPTRTIDGVERFGAIRQVPDYPLAVLVTRDTSVALAAWREQAVGTAVRTLVLGALAALLLTLLMRKLARLRAASASLEASKERFAAAVAGSDDGIWDWDVQAKRVFASARAREILGLLPGPEKNDAAQWFASLRFHPDDRARRIEAMQAHLDGRSPAYAIEYRVQRQDGSWHWVRARGLCVRDSAGQPQRVAGSVTDIDAQRRAEDALRESEERSAIAMTGSNEGHWVWNLATDELFMSAMAKEIFDLPPEAPFTTRAEFLKQLNVHPDDVARLQKQVDDHVAGDTPRLETEYRIILRDGAAIRWIQSRGQCFRDASGQAVRMAGATIDVSERKRAEDSLRQSEKRFALAVAGSNDGIVDWDVVHDRMYSSKRAMRIMGIESDVTVRSRAEWRDLVKYHPDDVQRVRDDLQNFLDGQVELREGEYRVCLPDGEYRWIRHRNKCVRDAAGRPIRVAGSISDIDAHKRAEEALRESEERYQLAVVGSNEGMWDWDMRGDTFFFSARAQELLGLDPGEPMRPCGEWWTVFAYHPDDEKRVKDALAAYLGGAGKSWEVEYRLRHQRTGDWHWYRERGVALRDALDQPYRMAGSMEDITDRKDAEAQRDRLECQLRQAQKLEAIGTLAGGIAHDFNNVLAAILGYGEMAQKDAPEGTPLRRNIDAAISAGMRAKSLVEQILAFSRSGAGERVPVHVQSVVAETLDLVADSVPHGVRVERQLTAGDAAVLGDPTQIHQVVLNLCTNAMQAMKSDGDLTVELDAVDLAESRTVSTGVLASGSYVRLSVRDTGVGIAPQVLERMFDPFFTTKGVGVGTGLGLSLVHGIVTDLGGGIDVQSAPGAGATFTVYLPRQGRVAAPAVTEDAIAGGHGETILLVDDEEALVKVGEEMLAMLGYETVGFASSTAALETFRASPQRFDAVLSDEAMPDMTGSELAREIRKLHPDIPIVLMSGYVTPALHERAQDAGVVEVLAKPLVSRDIARSLAGVLRN
ncbi:MAG TPA: PAS domain-containing protein, partial [Burkholderiaceae bacterium]|nr:PAS domain-containing protein [Burkholderiaceae bacterium]